MPMFVFSNMTSVEIIKSKGSTLQLLDADQFLDYVKNSFSEVLLPVDTITKQGLLGKGYKE